MFNNVRRGAGVRKGTSSFPKNLANPKSENFSRASVRVRVVSKMLSGFAFGLPPLQKKSLTVECALFWDSAKANLLCRLTHWIHCPRSVKIHNPWIVSPF